MPDTFTTILLFIGALIFLLIGYYIGSFIATHRTKSQLETQLPDIRKDAIARSRAALGGKFSENLAPYFPDFPYSPTEMRWLGSPVDYIIFKGMDNDNISEMVFCEIKSGSSQLTKREKQIKELIEKNKISWNEYRIPEEITQK